MESNERIGRIKAKRKEKKKIEKEEEQNNTLASELRRDYWRLVKDGGGLLFVEPPETSAGEADWWMMLHSNFYFPSFINGKFGEKGFAVCLDVIHKRISCDSQVLSVTELVETLRSDKLFGKKGA